MTQWRVFQFTDNRGHGVITEWLRRERVPSEQIAEFQQKLDTLERFGPDAVPGFIFGPIGSGKKKKPVSGIYKLKIKGNKGRVQLRPMICFGPFDGEMKSAVTLLLGAIERDSNLPEGTVERADKNRQKLIADPTRRRRQRLQGNAEK